MAVAVTKERKEECGNDGESGCCLYLDSFVSPLPLLAHPTVRKSRQRVIATYQKTIQEQKTDVKELRNTTNITIDPLPDQWGSLIWGGCTSFGGCVLRIPTYDGQRSWGSRISRTVELPIYHGTSEKYYRKGLGHQQKYSPGGGKSTTAF